jgi:hypothetical protein
MYPQTLAFQLKLKNLIFTDSSNFQQTLSVLGDTFCISINKCCRLVFLINKITNIQHCYSILKKCVLKWEVGMRQRRESCPHFNFKTGITINVYIKQIQYSCTHYETVFSHIITPQE